VPSIVVAPDVVHLAAELLGEPIDRSEPARWGFAAQTHVLTLRSGRRVVLQRRAAGDGPDRAARMRQAIDALRSGGIPVPTLLASLREGHVELTVFALVEGVPGPEVLIDPLAGPALADAMGALLPRLAAIDPAALPADPGWRDAASLSEGLAAWSARLGGDAPHDPARRTLAQIVARGWAPVIAHGDFVPANVIVADGGIAALIDLAGAGRGHPLLDAAWWVLMVRHHHTALAPRLVPRMLLAAGISPRGRDADLLPAIALLRAVQLAAGAVPGEARDHLLHLAATAVTLQSR
jgi:aminoglycoside phosphotransferase (APT) family kinase protein